MRVGILAGFFGLLILWPVLLIVAIMVKIKMPGGPAFFCQKRVEKMATFSGQYPFSDSGDTRSLWVLNVLRAYSDGNTKFK